eukprot:EC712918.1.p1 GENE.EC712918.1~~EC712918.1.p1  ORF type:complete len:58 (-),score=8.84 EC712918.1:43-216(-)
MHKMMRIHYFDHTLCRVINAIILVATLLRRVATDLDARILDGDSLGTDLNHDIVDFL